MKLRFAFGLSSSGSDSCRHPLELSCTTCWSSIGLEMNPSGKRVDCRGRSSRGPALLLNYASVPCTYSSRSFTPGKRHNFGGYLAEGKDPTDWIQGLPQGKKPFAGKSTMFFISNPPTFPRLDAGRLEAEAHTGLELGLACLQLSTALGNYPTPPDAGVGVSYVNSICFCRRETEQPSQHKLSGFID